MNNKIIFMTTTRPYDEYFKNIQLNAINSWLQLDMDKLIVINSNDSINQEFFNHPNVKIRPLKRQSGKGVPHVKDMFESGYEYYEKGDMLCYINADMILLNDFCSTLKSIPIHTFSNYLISGQKWQWTDVDNFVKKQTFPLDIESIKKNGTSAFVCATDYFIHNKELYQNAIPDDMLIARMHWDMWINNFAIKRNATTIDISNTCFAIHPGHWYGGNGNVKLPFHEYNHRVDDELKINRKYESPQGTIDRYRNYTVIENGQIILRQR